MKRARAFTMVELMVVLAIVALLSAITFGVLSSLREGNKRGTCQANLNQLYGAARLYAQDFDGHFPFLNASTSGPTSVQTPRGGLGLWALYAYPPAPTDALKDANCNNLSDDLPLIRNNPLQDGPLTAYLKAPRILHCPSDDFEHPVSYATSSSACATKTLRSAEQEFDPGDGVRRLNPFFLSYQTQDDAPNTATYDSFRGANVKRQLRFYSNSGGTVSTPDRRSPDQTVVTWCRFHRKLNADGTTKTGDNAPDNVLFLDGSVQSVRASQSVKDTTGTAKTCDGWKRVPLGESEKVPADIASMCN